MLRMIGQETCQSHQITQCLMQNVRLIVFLLLLPVASGTLLFELDDPQDVPVPAWDLLHFELHQNETSLIAIWDLAGSAESLTWDRVEARFLNDEELFAITCAVGEIQDPSRILCDVVIQNSQQWHEFVEGVVEGNRITATVPLSNEIYQRTFAYDETYIFTGSGVKLDTAQAPLFVNIDTAESTKPVHFGGLSDSGTQYESPPAAEGKQTPAPFLAPLLLALARRKI